MLRIFFMKKNKIKNCPDNLNIYTTKNMQSYTLWSGWGNPYNYHNIESDTMWYRIEIYKSNESTSYPKFRTMSKVLEEYTLFLNFSKKIWKRKQRKYSIRKWGKMQFYLLFEWYEKTYTCSELQLLRILSIDLKLKIKSIIPSN